jgi:hypothetical protein
VQVYDLSTSTPTVPSVFLANSGPGSRFGESVAISGTRVLVQARGSNNGLAYVYDIGSATPTDPVATLGVSIAGYGKNLVAISGPLVLVGVGGNDAGALGAGRGYVYDMNSPTPTVPLAILNNPFPHEDDTFGASVAIDGAVIAIGTPGLDIPHTNEGAAYIFDVPALPTVTTIGASDVTGSSARLGGTVNAHGSSTLARFEITRVAEIAPAYVVAEQNPITGSTSQAISATATGLASRTSYRVRTVAQNPGGTVYGAEVTFTTLNENPNAATDTAMVPYQTATVLDVLANDSDADGDPLIITDVQNPAHGSVQIVPNSSGQRVRYAPAPGYSGDDSFTYDITDGFGGNAVGTSARHG